MSSREIANVTGKRHDNVKRDIVAMLKDLKVDVLSFEDIYLDGRNREQLQYLLDREYTDCLLTGYSAPMRMKVIRRWRELEGQGAARQSVIANGTKVIGELAILECFTRLLKPAPSSQVMMLNQIAVNNGLDPKFLPGYAIDAASDATGGSSMATKSATALLKDNDIRVSPAAFNKALGAAGYLKTMQRKNSKQEMVDFWSITDKGLRFGKNLTSPQSPRETQPHWYVDRFLELAGLIGKGRS
ncbi:MULTISPECIES: Rha family transcriptional regulator [unclassified Pseudomonas]|uniref:Rha family transcriptional regulator n=1 Tax=unclassified Pseudomonas TaxID=196821 RepID=UPI002B224E6E|nr:MULTISPECIES: Rha family transcriptional regulator [unclassified Pseudomonas]MEA9994565.1 Rha family transcriptional regulator [Pseudomonas sp. AA4]MEB0085710.1 Rha family transcriptional regulator [Pseudomonas sp. RTI1]MEB0125965.1 Rha family transcriptional regulator [Pseudomonas sp. CCC1.2]MEB0152769.1 Rha family transcriptional regulator [Pseudomonas sp. CCC4.3]MEB0221274.1 Rha family transcriptional regulator [Pseudomonas sp. AB12(2023)]